ncbi:MAG TPA: lipid A deacylase LpxR family protein [Usitatibacter sp.]|nr:lipid A deacylase LpxR family protein [Usitatibacter sp.]
MAPLSWRIAVTALFALGAALPACAKTRFASITFENDFFAGYDRHYTNGLQLAFLAELADVPAALRASRPLAWSAEPEAVVAIGQRIYTPSDTDITVPDPRDRPYAGWLYAMTDVRTRIAPTIDHLTLVAGVVGPASLARQMQDGVHRLLHEPLSKGWDYQVRTRPTFMVGYERAWPGVLEAPVGHDRMDLALRAGAALGTPFTYADAGAVLRYGRNLPADIPATHLSLGPPRDGFRGTRAFGWYLWAGVEARAIGYNTFIQGSTFRQAPDVNLEHFGYDAQVGVTLAWPEARVGFSLVQRSKEFDRQQGDDRYGQLAVSFAY